MILVQCKTKFIRQMLVNEIMPYCHQNSYRVSKLSIRPILIISQIKSETKPWIQKNLYPRLCPPRYEITFHILMNISPHFFTCPYHSMKFFSLQSNHCLPVIIHILKCLSKPVTQYFQTISNSPNYEEASYDIQWEQIIESICMKEVLADINFQTYC